MASDSHDDAFFALPRFSQRRIDKAFHTYCTNVNGVSTPSLRSSKKRKLANVEDDASGATTGGGGFLIDDEPGPSSLGDGGGFILDDADAHMNAPSTSYGGGGFLVDDADTGAGFIRESETEQTSEAEGDNPDLRISMSDIPAALQLLDLPPDDEQVLSVFRNAASGWDDASASDRDSGMVSLDDWRAVCTILFEQKGQDQDRTGEFSNENESAFDGGGRGFIPQTRPTNRGSEMDVDYLDSSDAHVSDDADSDDEYQEGPSPSKSSSGRRRATTKSRTGGRRRRAAADSDSDASMSADEGDSRPITSRQKATCLEAFALFFPTVDANDLPKQKIMIKDIQRVANLLNEKIKADEMLEMLEVFSTSPDKSMSLQDFERMMLAARLA